MFLILASESNDMNSVARIMETSPYKSWTAGTECLAANHGATKSLGFSALLDLIDWSLMEALRVRRTKIAAEVSNRLVASGAADLRSIDDHINELRRAHASWGKGGYSSPDLVYDGWLRTFVSGNAAMLFDIANSSPPETWEMINSGIPMYDWIDGPFFSARALLDRVSGRDVIYEMAKPWEWVDVREAFLSRLPSNCFLSVLEVEK